jgi:inosine-uridine nucleoside N-ribohydrolase
MPFDRGRTRRRRRNVIMDVDTGIDDAIAIIVALQSPDIRIIGITSVNGIYYHHHHH